MRATWHGKTLAESDDTVVVEGNHYFPRDAADPAVLRPSEHHSTCPWKGQASYFDVVVDGEVNENACWTYEDPKPAAERIRGRLAFWHGVEVTG